MTRNIKVFSLALVAMLTMGIAASSAMAVEFHEGGTNTNLSGAQEGRKTFALDSGTFHCANWSYSGSMSGATASEIELAPTTSGCESTGFIKANVTFDTNGCKYNLTAATSNQMVHITGCNAGAAGMVLTAPFCTITFTPQTIGPVDYETAGSAGTTHEVIVNTTIANITYHESGFACAHSGSTTTGGQSVGKFRITAADAATATHVGFTVE